MLEKVGRSHGIDDPVQMTVATTDGESLWVFRYSSEGKSRSLFFSTKVATLRQLHPEVEVLHRLGEEARFVVSEPLRDLLGALTRCPSPRRALWASAEDEITGVRPVAS